MNPASGAGRAGRIATAVAERLRKGAEVSVRTGASAEESSRLLAKAAGTGDAVVVLGGDGTVHLALQALAQTTTPLGIIAAGTGNDTADALGLPCDPLLGADAVLAALAAGSARPIDLGRTAAGRWWATVLCSGFDSAVNERANRMRWPRGPRRYDLAIVVEMLKLRPRPFTICTDGREEQVEATLVAVGNTPQYGGGKLITPHARMDDAIFEVCVVGAVSRLTLARLAPTLPRAGHLNHPAVRTFEARTVTVSAPATVGYADGERIGPLPLSTTCEPAAITVLVPPAAVGRGLHRLDA